MEVEAKDSEEEAEVSANLNQNGGKDTNKSPNCLKVGIINSRASPKSATEVPKMLVYSCVPEAPSGIDSAMSMLTTPGKVRGSHQVLSFDNINVPELNGCEYTGISRNALHERSPNCTKVGDVLASTSKTAEILSHSGSKLSSMSYSRKIPRKSTHSISSGKERNDVLDIVSSKMENADSRIPTDCFETVKRGADSSHEEDSSGILPQKRMSNILSASSKSAKMSQDAKAWNLGSQTNHKTLASENKSSACHSVQIDGHYTDEAANLVAALNSHTSVTADSSSSFKKDPLTPNMPSFKTVSSEALHNADADRKSPETSMRKPKKSTVASKVYTGDFGMSAANVVGEEGELQNQQHDFDISSFENRFPDVDKSPRPVDMYSLQRGNDKSIAKPIRKKTVAKKTLVPRHTANQKGSIYSKKIASPNDPEVCLNEEERGNQEKVSTTSELETAPSTASNEAVKQVDTDIVTKFGDTVYKTETMNDETEAPDDKDEHEFDEALNDEKFRVVGFTHKEDTMVERIPEVTHESKDSDVFRHDQVTAKEGIGTEQGITDSDKTFVDESTSEMGGLKQKLNKGKKRHSGKANTETVSTDKETIESKKKVWKGIVNRNKNKEEGIEEEKNFQHPRSKPCDSTASANKLSSSVEANKENRPIADVCQTSSLGVGKSILNSMKAPMKINKKFEKVNSMPVGEVLNKLKDEPVWFILSGHRLQRKEFQLVIRRLKGRVCRDSHQWSYQATHFIAPDPIRRTEKFFAATASGR